MASRRTSSRVDVMVSNLAEEQMAKFVRGLTPWIVWILGMPAAVIVFSLLARAVRNPQLVSLSLAVAALVVTLLVWRINHSRGIIGRIHHALNSLGSLGWVAVVIRYGWFGLRGWVLISYAIGGLVMALAWNLRYSVHTDGPEDITDGPKRKGGRVNGGYLVRVLAGRFPSIRRQAERGAKVVPGLNAPWRPDHAAPAAVASGSVVVLSGRDTERATAQARAISHNFRDLAATKARDLSGARLRIIDAKPWRIRGEVVLVRGVQTPKAVEGARELLASQCALPLSGVIVKPNPTRHDRVYIDFVLKNVLADPVPWPGPHAIGQSIAAAPTRFGVYEDRSFAERFGAAIGPDMAKRLHRPEKNLSHLLSEGMNGSGKSSAQRILIADGATRLDIEEWLIDTVKQTQTFGRLADAIKWFATTPNEARSLIRFLADRVIPARADYLGTRGYDNWEVNCGIPYLRVTIEEGGIIANELDKLDAVLNSARSTGTEINLSAQRVHHALVDTNVRAAFGDTLSFGAKSLEDVFAMAGDMLDAGADPSLWANKQPGMCYYGAADLDLDKQLTQARAFAAMLEDLAAVIGEYAPIRDGWIRDNCPDWEMLLARIDVNGLYASRTTGADVAARMSSAAARKNQPPRAVKAIAVPPADASPVSDYPPDLEEEKPVTVDELDLDTEDPEMASAAREDSKIDPTRPLPAEPADQQIDFGRPRAQEMDRESALGLLRGFLMRHKHGWEFAPRDLYGEVCAATGRSAGWVRQELSTTLVAERLVERDRTEGKYRVLLEPVGQLSA